MRPKFLPFYSISFLVLSLSAVAKVSETIHHTVADTSSHHLSGRSSFASFGDDTTNAIFVDKASIDNNEITLLEYQTFIPLGTNDLTEATAKGHSRLTKAASLGNGREGEFFLNPISKVSNYNKVPSTNYKALNINQTIEVGSEPETFSMMFAGLILMAFVARRRSSYRLTDTVFSESARSSL